MTIEERAREKLNEVRKEWSAGLLGNAYTRLSDPTIEAFCREIETHDAERAAHAAFRQEVSDAVKEVVSRKASPLKLRRFIIAKPDPLVEVFREVRKHHAKEGEEWAEAVVRRAHDAAAELGYKLKLVEVGDAD